MANSTNDLFFEADANLLAGVSPLIEARIPAAGAERSIV